MTNITEMLNQSLKNRPFFSSWSGGKDSCLALYRAIQAGGEPKCLLTMFTQEGERSRSHGLSKAVIRAQAESLGIPMILKATSWQEYESNFLDALREINDSGIKLGVFGDIDLIPHLRWVEQVCEKGGVTAVEPLWMAPRRELLNEFISAGFLSTIVAVKDGVLNADFLGRTLTMELVEEFEALGIDASGEKGEYHTVVTDGPIFSARVGLEAGEKVLRDGYWFLDLHLAAPCLTEL